MSFDVYIIPGPVSCSPVLAPPPCLGVTTVHGRAQLPRVPWVRRVPTKDGNIESDIEVIMY